MKRDKVRAPSFYLSPSSLTGREGQCNDCLLKPWFDKKGNPIRSYPRLVTPGPMNKISSPPSRTALVTTSIRKKSLTGLKAIRGERGCQAWRIK